MRKYHILFNESGKDFSSRGQNFEASTVMGAIENFSQAYPSATFIGLYDIDALTALQVIRKSIAEQVEENLSNQLKLK